MSVELATAYVSLTVEAKNVARETARQMAPVEGEAKKVGKRAGDSMKKGIGGSFKGIAALFGGAMAAIGVKNFLGDALSEARESQKVGALTTSIIKSTGGAAKVTAKQVGDLATAISNKTGVDDEAVQTGANLLLTFKNVRNEAGKGNDMFNRATAAAVDLSKAGFGSIDSASKMLGKALNDPIKGITALSRAGVTFSEKQKETIKTMVQSGDTLGAQRLIMKELESQVGGAAAATATAGDKAKVVFDNLKESAGTFLLPIVDKLATKFMDLVTQFQNGEGVGGRIRDIFNGIGDVISKVVDSVQLFIGSFTGAGADVEYVNNTIIDLGAYARQTFDYFTGTVWPFMVKYQDILVPVAAGIAAIVAAIRIWRTVTMAYTAVQTALNVVLTANPIGIVILAIVGLVAALVVAYKKSETFRAIVDKVWAGVKAAIKGTVDWFKNTAWPAMRDTFTWIGDKGKWLWNSVLSPTFNAIKAGVGKVKDAFETAKTGIGKAWGALEELAKKPIRFIIETVLNKGLLAGFNWISEKIGGPHINSIPLPKGFAKGGVLPGYTPGRDVHRFYSQTGGVLDLSGGEAIMRPEFTRMVGGEAGVKALNTLAQHSYAGGGIINWIKKKGSDAFNWMSDKASAIYRAVTHPMEFLKSKIPAIPGSDLLSEYAAGAKNKLLSLASARVKSLFKIFKGGYDKVSGEGIGSNARGWQQLWNIVHGLLPGLALTSSVRPGSITASGNLSYHSMGRAIDVAPPSMAAFNKIRNAFPNATELIYSPAGARQLKNGKSYVYGEPVRGMHYNHIHLAMAAGGVIPKPLLFDRGGVLPEGTSLVHNGTGAPEPLMRADSGNVTVYMTVSVDDLAKLNKLDDFLAMLDNARVNGRKVASGRTTA